MSRVLVAGSWLVAAVVVLSGCTTLPSSGDVSARRTTPVRAKTEPQPAEASAAESTPAQPGAKDEGPYRVSKGTGVFVSPRQAGVVETKGVASGPGVTLNFENADLREVVRNILGDVLNVNYIIDPQVQGSVTIRTAREIPRTALLPTLETMLRMNGHTIVEEAGMYKVQPAALAVRGNTTPQLGSVGRPLPAGYNVLLVPLRFVGVREMLRILEPFAKDAQAIRPDELRNMLILSGTERELAHLVEIVDMFDVDWIAGMSVGLFTLQSADVKAVGQEIERVFGDRNTSPLTGILRFVPIERMNALLVISTQPKYIDEAKKWIERLDKAGEGAGQRLYVYFMKNGRADRVAPLLQQALTGRVTQQFQQTGPSLAPGETPAFMGTSTAAYFQNQPGGTAPGSLGTLGTVPGATGASPISPISPIAGGAPTGLATGAVQPGAVGAGASAREPTAVAAAGAIRPLAGTPPAAGRPGAAAAAGAAGGADGGIGIARNVQIVADKDQNSLLIVATPSEYALIEAALKKLDIAPRQVMIEMTVVEVLLKDEFALGVEWYFSAGADVRGVLSNNVIGPANLLWSNTSNGGSGSTTNSAFSTQRGFNIAWQSAAFPGGVRAVLNTLATNSKTKVIANPHVLATDNQKASIKVGDRIPIVTNNYYTGTVGTTPITTTTQYLDTGVLVTVVPKINVGGLVTLDLAAEFSNAGNQPSPDIAPPINSRSAQTLVTVQSGETMVLAGLILENRGNSTDGFPFLSEIPIFGSLFGNQNFTNNRTELVLFITPRVVESNADMRMVTEEIRRKMEWVDIDQLIPRRPE